jgi:hypothetical protein
MVFKATFNNFSVISWSLLFVEETGWNPGPGMGQAQNVHIYAQSINNTWHIWYIPLIAAQLKTDIRVISWNIWKQTVIINKEWVGKLLIIGNKIVSIKCKYNTVLFR